MLDIINPDAKLNEAKYTIIFNDAINIKLKEPIVNYVSKEDFLKFSGKDLDLEFKNGNYDIGDPVPMFIKRVETASITLLEERYDNYNIEEIRVKKRKKRRGLIPLLAIIKTLLKFD